jgi:hypothetical protein
MESGRHGGTFPVSATIAWPLWITTAAVPASTIIGHTGTIEGPTGLGLWANGDTSQPGLALGLAVAATFGAMLSMASKDRIALLGLTPAPERALGWLLGGPRREAAAHNDRRPLWLANAHTRGRGRDVHAQPAAEGLFRPTPRPNTGISGTPRLADSCQFVVDCSQSCPAWVHLCHHKGGARSPNQG